MIPPELIRDKLEYDVVAMVRFKNREAFERFVESLKSQYNVEIWKKPVRLPCFEPSTEVPRYELAELAQCTLRIKGRKAEIIHPVTLTEV